jgi:hypothetical protein
MATGTKFVNFLNNQDLKLMAKPISHPVTQILRPRYRISAF